MALNTTIAALFKLVFFPGGLFVVLCGLFFMWLNRKLMARFQNRIGPPWYQSVADMAKLLINEEITPQGANTVLFQGLPVVALAGAMTAALYIPIGGVPPAFSFPGDLVVTIYMLSLLTLCTGLAGSLTADRFSLIGATRAMTQLFSYEVPFLLALLGPALVAESWQINEIMTAAGGRWLLFSQPIGFVAALVGLMGKLEMHPFDAPEAETEIVAGALTEYSGRGLALFHLGRGVELIIGLTLVAALFMGGLNNPLFFLVKTLGLLMVLALTETLMTRLRIDQTVDVWWHYIALLVLVQLFVVVMF